MTNKGHEIAMAPCFDPNDARAIVNVLVGDALDQPGEYLPIRRLGLHVHVCTLRCGNRSPQ